MPGTCTIRARPLARPQHEVVLGGGAELGAQPAEFDEEGAPHGDEVANVVAAEAVEVRRPGGLEVRRESFPAGSILSSSV